MAAEIEKNNDEHFSENERRSEGGLCLGENSNSEDTSLTRSENHQPTMDTKSKIFLKSVYFSMFASIGVIASFFPLYLKELGLSPSIIGIVLFFRPVGGFIAGIVSPNILAKFRHEWKALMGFSILFLVFMFSVVFLPTANLKETCPTKTFKLLNDSITIASTPSNETFSNHNLRTESTFENKRNNNGTKRLLNSTSGNVEPQDLKAEPKEVNNRPNSWENDTDVDANRDNFSDIETEDNSWLFAPENLTVIIVILTIVVFSGEFCFVGLDTAVVGITMRSLGEGNSAQYGFFRSWGAIGHGIGATITGAAVTLTVHDVIACGRTVPRGDYHVMFYVFLCLGLLTCLNVKNIAKAPSDGRDNSVKEIPSGDLRRALCTVRNIAWLFVIFSRSIFYAVTQGFLYWHMDNIGASPILIGLANCVTTTTEFLAFFATPKLIEIFGEAKLVGVGIISYICRFILFSVIVNPVYILPVEIIEGVAFACIWSSILSHLSRQVGPESQIHIAGLVQALLMLGTSIGFLLSGALVQVAGSAAMFLTFAAIATVTMVIFCLAHVVS